jgi:hypothetical protein
MKRGIRMLENEYEEPWNCFKQFLKEGYDPWGN